MKTADGVEALPHNLVWVLDVDEKGQPIGAKLVVVRDMPPGVACYASRDALMAAASAAQQAFWARHGQES